ncbi:transcription elongation factor SPT4 isoform X1 [Chrysemys picta bellii]|uniref:transcription elongation factor SPT4 isoform X1 n=1 Tax=Chrysemys picta bellii TaxID=8478 RepID=UPI001C685223|nr:transcription elongation factor SPT4 isoform X1 [Chrysemys picta bellii]
MALETVPKDLRHLRACLLCSLVKTIDQFEYDGCDNCDAYLQMKGNREMVYDCTSSSFDGDCAGAEEPRCGLQIPRHSHKNLSRHCTTWRSLQHLASVPFLQSGWGTETALGSSSGAFQSGVGREGSRNS